jgi:hypothetical protein
MRLPEVVDRLHILAVELDCEELNRLTEITRRPSGQRAPRTSAPMTNVLREQIRAIKEADPELSHAEIGRGEGLRENPVDITTVTSDGKNESESGDQIAASAARLAAAHALRVFGSMPPSCLATSHRVRSSITAISRIL